MERIIVGMSGGVDSAVAALLLKEQGYEVIGVFMKNWDEMDAEGVCTADDDFHQVRAVCDALEIPYYAVNFTREYWDRVFSYFLSEYAAGRTPNPDVLCNREIKFKAFLNFANQMEADRLATGHYARIGTQDGLFTLRKAADLNKDQSYFLHVLGQKELSKAYFPIGEMEKPQVRALAEKACLSNAKRKDSTGICFIGERNFTQFLKQYLPAQPGEMRDLETGELLGKHDGLMYYTLGQRKGLGIGGRLDGDGTPWFVVSKDMEHNILYLAQGKDHPALYSRGCHVSGLSWVAGSAPRDSFLAQAKFRYRQPDQPVEVRVMGDRAEIISTEPQRAITPGQYAVLYQGDICLGGGVIEDTFV